MRLIERPNRFPELASSFYLVVEHSTDSVQVAIRHLNTISEGRAKVMFLRAYEAASACQMADMEEGVA